MDKADIVTLLSSTFGFDPPPALIFQSAEWQLEHGIIQPLGWTRLAADSGMGTAKV